MTENYSIKKTPPAFMEGLAVLSKRFSKRDRIHVPMATVIKELIRREVEESRYAKRLSHVRSGRVEAK